jgi:hypothetical protein
VELYAVFKKLWEVLEGYFFIGVDRGLKYYYFGYKCY